MSEAENNPKIESKPPKSTHAEREEHILAQWKEKDIFKKSLSKPSPKGEFIFYEGPPTANGRPGIHHLEARAFKDAIPRYKTMRGYHVRRKGGWDTHGLPVELQVEKELGLKSKKEIDTYGIALFNEKCKESVWKYVREWEDFTNRMGYWVDLQSPYVTYKPEYIESVWNIIKHVNDKGLLYKDYKVVPWCPRCGTGLSSHELAQGYEDVKDLAVTVKFKVKVGQKIGDTIADDATYLLAWTTTPWTLPGNVGLAVGNDVEYVKIKVEENVLILAKDRLSILKDTRYEIKGSVKGSDLVGLSYEPLYPFLKDNISGAEKEKLGNAYKVYAAGFVTTTDGTGIVHTAVMYGQDDFDLGTKVGLPKYHLVNEDGTFKKEAGFLAGKFVKDEATDVEIIKDLANRPTGSLLFHKEKHQHSYPHCWRCHTPLIYFARDSWYIRMFDLRDKLVKENEKINWEPYHIKEGRFGEWLREVKDWAISRERYWGTPLPVWKCEKCNGTKVVGKIEDVKKKAKNNYWVMRHGEAESNVTNIVSDSLTANYHLTKKGIEDAKKTADSLIDKNIDLIFASPLTRTQETAEIIRERLGLDADSVVTDSRLRELGMGKWVGKNIEEFLKIYPLKNRFKPNTEGIENYSDLKKRMAGFLYEIEKKYDGKNIIIVTHGSPAMMLISTALGHDEGQAIAWHDKNYIHKATVRPLNFSIFPHNSEYELDLHRPFIDEVTFPCSCGGEMKRVKEVMDVWFDSGAMPFAQDHYPFENKKLIDGGFLSKGTGYPADYISEAIDQTRGWFYTLHAIGTLMGKGRAYKNVVCLGHILDKDGKKMSKSLGNVVNPWDMMDKYGADALRFWMYSVNQPGDSKNFDEKTVDEVVKKVFNLAANVLSFYQLYADTESTTVPATSDNVLDKWIIARLNQSIQEVTKGLDNYKFLEPTRATRDFVADLSQWYLRRSRDRFKEEGVERQNALVTTRFVLIELAKLMAPFAPFFSDFLYQGAGGKKDSVHLEDWPVGAGVDSELILNMEKVRSIASQGLEARMKAKINVRQPLQTLRVKVKESRIKEDSSLVGLIRDEVNVKDVVFGASIESAVELDIAITPELKEEGEVRELVRKIQDLRKEKGLSVGDVAILVATEDMRQLISKNSGSIKKATGLSGIEFGAVLELKV